MGNLEYMAIPQQDGLIKHVRRGVGASQVPGGTTFIVDRHWSFMGERKYIYIYSYKVAVRYSMIRILPGLRSALQHFVS
jgi:hypothetical protein